MRATRAGRGARSPDRRPTSIATGRTGRDGDIGRFPDVHRPGVVKPWRRLHRMLPSARGPLRLGVPADAVSHEPACSPCLESSRRPAIMRRPLRFAVLLGVTCLCRSWPCGPSSRRPRRGRASRPPRPRRRPKPPRPRPNSSNRIKEEEAEAVAGHGDPELPDRRDRPAADRLAEHEAGQRVDARPAGGVGAGQRPPRGVGAVRPGLDAQAVLGPGDRAAVHPADRLSQGVVARHRGHAGRAGRLLRRQVRGRLRQVQGEAQRGDRADRPGPRGPGALRAAGRAEDRFGAARAGRRRRARRRAARGRRGQPGTGTARGRAARRRRGMPRPATATPRLRAGSR